MAGKATKSTIPSTSANKDLSCLRCRKKKAKCSKTRPTCTRCSRSNQPCEYPDAPPNLTDLSQKVLTLYDTLRELEGEFLVKYMQTLDEDQHDLDEIEHESTLYEDEPDYSSTTNSLLQYNNNNNEMEQDNINEEPGGWSMSLTSDGLSIQVVTRNFNEYNEFAKTISRQIMRDFGANYLPKNWDAEELEAEEEEEEEEEIDEEDELDEDEYLVTVPVISTFSLLFNQEEEEAVEEEKREEIDVNIIIQLHLSHMFQYLKSRIQSLQQQEEQKHQQHHLAVLVQQLCLYLPLEPNQNMSKLQEICIIIGYIVSITILPPPSNFSNTPPLSRSTIKDSIQYVTMLLMDIVFTTNDTSDNNYVIILCLVLIAWTNIEFDNNTTRIIYIATRLLCGSNWKNKQEWQILISSLIYIDVYNSTFKFKELQGTEIWKSSLSLSLSSSSSSSSSSAIKPTNSKEVTTILIEEEGKLMSLLNKVISLFYKVEKDFQQQTEEKEERKIDVDEVLTLVRDIELWEQELPNWLKWDTDNNGNLHLHMIHNIIKILLFRPFSSDQQEQTFTRTTFLDMSIISADKLSICLLNINEANNLYWIKSSYNLIQDLFKRVLNMFNNDQDVINQLDIIKLRLEQLKLIKRKTVN